MPKYVRQAAPSKGVFLKWEPGESKDLVILSETGTEEDMHWVEGESKDCTGAGCALCEAGVRRTKRWEILARCQGEEVPWAMSNTTMYGVEDVAEMAGHLKDLRLRVTRHGTGRKTRYSVLPLIGQETSPSVEAEEQTLAQDIRDMCAGANLDPKQELALFLSEEAPELRNAPQLSQMRGFYAYIADKTGTEQDEDKPPPEKPEDIGKYF